MENNSIGKNSIDNGIEVYSVTAMFPNGEILGTFITLDRKLAVEKAFYMDEAYHEFDMDSYNVFIDTWKDNEMIKTECIYDGELTEIFD